MIKLITYACLLFLTSCAYVLIPAGNYAVKASLRPQITFVDKESSFYGFTFQVRLTENKENKIIFVPYNVWNKTIP
jgi:hypothetical protein